MGKSKGKQTPRSKAGQQEKATSAAPAGPSRVFFLRHGQSESNATGRDVPDPHLTDLGRMQASAWKGDIARFGAEVVIVSPLRRAIQTALLAYDGVDLHVEVCRHAREMWWDEKTNHFSTPEMLHELLATLPRGDAVCGVEQALYPSDAWPRSENESIRALKAELANRPEGVVCVVCHWGVINSLTGENADNGQVIECRRTPNGQYLTEKHHDPPRGQGRTR